MGLFGFGKKKSTVYTYRMLFSTPFNADRDQQVKGLALKCLADAGMRMSTTKTTCMGCGAKSEFIGEPGESITITNDAVDGGSSFISIEVKTSQVSAEAVKAAFANIRNVLYDADIFFREF
ncbi:MAG: hypothetical protein PUE49_02395 [Eggerthellales bacterium]|nr:hypothetical protein [Eggerthellales bacterium]